MNDEQLSALMDDELPDDELSDDEPQPARARLPVSRTTARGERFSMRIILN